MSKIDKSPKHGTTNDTPQSESQPDGTGADAPRGETQARGPRQTNAGGGEAQPSGYNAQNPASAGKQSSPTQGHTPENRQNAINPSAPTEGTEAVENAGPHPSSKGSGLSDTFGEAGDPHGRGNLQIPDQTINQEKNFPDSNYAGNNPTPDQPGTEGAGNVKRKRDEEAA